MKMRWLRKILGMACPECGAGPHYGHAATCSQIELRQARWNLAYYVQRCKEWEETYWKALALNRAECDRLRHENNQLRKKLYPGKC